MKATRSVAAGERVAGSVCMPRSEVAALAVAVHGYVKCEPNSSTPRPTL
ncbi:hypothetical protein ACIF85_01950 [Streptomyces sp. NPDC086033]